MRPPLSSVAAAVAAGLAGGWLVPRLLEALLAARLDDVLGPVEAPLFAAVIGLDAAALAFAAVAHRTDAAARRRAIQRVTLGAAVGFALLVGVFALTARRDWPPSWRALAGRGEVVRIDGTGAHAISAEGNCPAAGVHLAPGARVLLPLRRRERWRLHADEGTRFELRRHDAAWPPRDRPLDASFVSSFGPAVDARATGATPAELVADASAWYLLSAGRGLCLDRAR